MPEISIKDVVAQFCAKIPEQSRMFVKLIDRSLNVNHPDTEALEMASFEAHRMAGSAGSFGFTRLGELYGRIEELLKTLHADMAEDAKAAEDRLLRLVLLILEEGRNARPENSGLVGPDPAGENSAGVQRSIGTNDAGAAMRDERILFADDDRSLWPLVRRILLDQGAASVSVAASGGEALALAEDCDPTLIISDWNMTPVTGIELLKTIRGARSCIGPGIPIIFLTRENQASELRTALQLGVDHFVLKPFNAENLIRAIRSVLERRRLNPAAYSNGKNVVLV